MNNKTENLAKGINRGLNKKEIKKTYVSMERCLIQRN
jgi:hypothetical protein